MGFTSYIVYLLFFISGVTSLIFENLWVRMLSLVFGSTTLAVSSVLASFMGGLALGSYIFGKKADSIPRPLRFYAMLEGAVGLWALLSPVIITKVYPYINRWMWEEFHLQYFTFSFVRLIFTVLIILPPTTLMGGTLPLLSRFVVGTKKEYEIVGLKTGFLYATNTFGAITGAAVSGFLMMPFWGVRWTNFIASALNLLILCAATILLEEKITKSLWTRRKVTGLVEDFTSTTQKTEKETVTSAPSCIIDSKARTSALIVFGLSGLASMNYQVIWSRALSMVIGSSVYSFTVILVAFLVGIAVGSALFSLLVHRAKNPILWLGLIQVWIAVSSIGIYFAMDHMPYFFATLVTTVKNYNKHVGLIQFFMFATAFVSTIPATLGMGATFPVTVRIYCSGLERVGTDIGKVYSINTIGSIIGSFAGAFLLVPFFSAIGYGYGLQWSMLLGIFLNLLCFAILILTGQNFSPVRRVILANAPILILGVIVFLVIKFNLYWNPGKMTIGPFRISLDEDILDEESWGEPEIPYYFDGISTTVTVERWGKHIALKNNGKVEASNGDDMSTQVMVSALPMFMQSSILDGNSDVLLVGWGSGVSAASAMAFPIRSLEVVELEKRVIDASRHFQGVTKFDFPYRFFPYVKKEGLKIVLNDARNYLSHGLKKYDIIISEPSNPWITGVSNLFTVDHFITAKKNLKRGGIFSQWVQLYEMSPGSICSIFKSFAYSFPYTAVFGADPGSTDTLMLGSNEPIKFDLKVASALLENEKVKEVLQYTGLEEPFDIFSGIIFSNKREILEFCNFAPLNTDDNAFVEFSAPRDLISYQAYRDYVHKFYDPEWSHGDVEELLGNIGSSKAERSENYANLALSLAKGKRNKLAGKYLVRAKNEEDTEMAELAVLVLSYLFDDQNEPEVKFGVTVLGPQIEKKTKEIFDEKYAKILKLIEMKENKRAFEILLELPEELWEFSDDEFQFLTAYLEFKNDRPGDSAKRLEAVIAKKDGYATLHPEIYYYLAKAYYNSYNEIEGVRQMKNFVLLKLAEKIKTKLQDGKNGKE